MWLYPVPAVVALCGWLYVFVSPAGQPGGWKFMIYAAGTVAAGLAAYFLMAYHRRQWPFAAP
jgi:hypothetical protein